ncbi:MAG: energy-coupling factor transporter transmembrane component T [Propionicimonas sp.]
MRLQRLDVRVKVAGFAAILVAMLVVTDPLGNALLLGLLLGGLAGAGTPLRGLWAMVQPLLLVIGLIVVVSMFTGAGLSRPGSDLALFRAWGVEASLGGLLVGLNFAVRILLMVVATYAFTISTPVDDLLAALAWARAPYWFSILVTTALAFVPTTGRRKDLIVEAQRARGARVRDTGPVGRLVAVVPIMVPLITTSIMLADNLAVAMTSRGYRASRGMTSMRDLRLRACDLVVLAGVAILLGTVLWLRFGLGLGVV